MSIDFDIVGAGTARWQRALSEGRARSETFKKLENRLASEGMTKLKIDSTGRTPGLQPDVFIEAVSPQTRTIYLHPTAVLYVDRTDGTRGPVPEAATLGHALEHLTSDRIPGDVGGPIYTSAGIREELRAILTENKITAELGGVPRAESSTMEEILRWTNAPFFPGRPDINK